VCLGHTEKLAEGAIVGPESIAIAGSGEIYTTLSDGRIVELDISGSIIRTVYFNGAINVSGAFLFENKSVYNDAITKMNWCTDQSLSHQLAYDVEGEKSCGRPLGIRYVKDNKVAKLYFLDSYTGLYKIELTKGLPTKIAHMVSEITPIIRKNEKADEVNYKPIKFFNDLDVSADEKHVYFTDSSFKFHRSQNRAEVLDGAPRGRLFHFDVAKGVLEPLLCGLHFPNGVQLTPSTKKSELLVVELARFRILKVNLGDLSDDVLASCEETGSLSQLLADSSSCKAVEVFLDAAPGLMDNIRPKGSSGSYLIGVGAKSTQPFSFIYLAYQSSLLRHIIGRIIPMQYVEHVVPKYGLVLEINSTGSIVDSYQDPTGSVTWLSEAHIHPVTKDMLLGSHSNHYLGKVPAAQLL
jgi:sugar lactone lactonase YvrE